MKKITTVILTFCLLSVSLFPQESVTSLPVAKITVAVLKFEGGIREDAITLADFFGSQLANKNIFDILTPADVAAAMKKHNFKHLDATDTENIKAIGQLINADYIIVGKIATLGNSELLTIQMINILTNKIEASKYATFEKITETLSFIDSMVDSVVAIEAEIETTLAPKSYTKPYKIGDIGPGGGLIFYIYTETNRYLECSENLGNVTWENAQTLAENYRGGGYDDWYLSTKKELNYIYENLRKKNFISDDGWFWSSSESRFGNVWVQRFSIGGQANDYYSKSHYNDVLVVRVF